MFALRPEPDLFDLSAWRQRLAELQADPESPVRAMMIEHAEAHIAAISAPPQKTAAEAT